MGTWAFVVFVFSMVLIVVAIANLILRIRRMARCEQRGFEVIMKPDPKAGQEARKD